MNKLEPAGISHITLNMCKENWKRKKTLTNLLTFVAWFALFGWHFHWIEKLIFLGDKIKFR